MATASRRPQAPPRGRYLATLCLITLGVVYGDIGTSPLYAIRECFYGPHAIAITPGRVLGVLSLVFWALVIVISIKYLAVVLRADNHGEGGILSLTALATPIAATGRNWRAGLVLIGLFGAALLYGDGIITPAISILGALEGLSVATPALGPFIVPVTIAILIMLFAIQSRGTAVVGALFGPVTLVWFVVLAILGVVQILREPAVLAAVNPVHAFRFFADTGWEGYLVLGSVFLVVTGGEALYADMGHFGTRPIRIDWFAIVLPALLLNYFGQGALLLEDPTAAENPFYRLAPAWAIFPLILLAVAAAVIASQAVISGAYSLTMQAVQLGFMPRLRIDHTSSHEFGQIFIGAMNRALMVGCILLVIGFQTSSNLAAAYGVAVTSTMVITTLLLYFVARHQWGWSAPVAIGLTALFLVVDLAFFGANIVKVTHGGWLPLLLGAAIYVLMTTWKAGRRMLAERMARESKPLTDFLKNVQIAGLARVPGTAVFMSGTSQLTPAAFRHNLEHNKVLHERVLFVTVQTRDIPHVAAADRLSVDRLGEGLHAIRIFYGFMDEPDVPGALAGLSTLGFDAIDPGTTTYFLGRETIIAGGGHGMARWRRRLFALISRNATAATTYFAIPPGRVVELGEQVEM
jgi:KUP system potassium uptake protein